MAVHERTTNRRLTAALEPSPASKSAFGRSGSPVRRKCLHEGPMNDDKEFEPQKFVTPAIGILLRSSLILVVVRPLSMASSARVERVSKEPHATACWPSAGEQRKWPRRRGNTRRALTAALDRTLRLATHRLSAEMHPIYRGWWCAVLVCAGAGGRWGRAEITFGGGHASHHVTEVNHQRPPVQYRSLPSNYRPSSAVKPPRAAPSPLSLARRLRPMRCTRAEPNSQARNTRALFM